MPSNYIEQYETDIQQAGGFNTNKKALFGAGINILGGGIQTGSMVAQFTASVQTNGNTAVNLFGQATPGFAGSITSLTITAIDTTAGIIEVFSAGGTITSISKGTVLGAVKGSVNSITTFASGSAIQVISNTANGAGNAIVVATYTVT